eukprot:g53397.t1
MSCIDDMMRHDMASSDCGNRSSLGIVMSTKEINLRVPKTEQLGEEFPYKTGGPKAAVMFWLNSGKVHPKYNRMSGITPWKNAICLCINIGGDNYDNVFFEEGRKMSWFASQTQHEGTPIVARLLDMGRQAKTQVKVENRMRDHQQSKALEADGTAPKTRVKDESRTDSDVVKPEPAGEGKMVVIKQETLEDLMQGLSRRDYAVLLKTLKQEQSDAETGLVVSKRGRGKRKTASCSPSSAKRVKREPSASSSSPVSSLDSDKVLLFCRLPKRPYVYCGELEYVEHSPASRPMRVIWKLKDFDVLATRPLFKRIVRFPDEETSARAS